MKFSDIYEHTPDEDILLSCIKKIQLEGPRDPKLLELLSHLKIAHKEQFQQHEEALLLSMGLFYKLSGNYAEYSIMDYAQSIFASLIRDKYGVGLTPIQAHILNRIDRDKSFSFSAPTSAGKSYILRRLINTSPSNIIIVLPSRALIQEYVMKLRAEMSDEILVSAYLAKVNIDINKKRVYVITPERGGALFTDEFSSSDFSLFLFDEAQLSEEKGRGYIFDAFVSAVYNKFEDSKKIFAHPFIANPEAQFSKYRISGTKSAYNYDFYSVGKVFAFFEEISERKSYTVFSPYDEKMGELQLEYDVVEKSIKGNLPVLFYVSKSFLRRDDEHSIYGDYIKLCPLITNPEAIKIIDEIADYLGADEHNELKKSMLVDSMKHGVVMHHGSMPLRVRYLIEKFVRSGYARLCFATSTLLQGINMPFHVVVICHYSFSKELKLKNLIGRAGRNTPLPVFDYGYVIIHKRNKKNFISRIIKTAKLEESSVFDKKIDPKMDNTEKELITSIQNGSFNYEYNLPKSRIVRLQLLSVQDALRRLFNQLFDDNYIITPKEYFDLNESIQSEIKTLFHSIYATSLQRKLYDAEKMVIDEAIPIFLARAHAYSLKAITYMRLQYTSINKFVLAQILPIGCNNVQRLFYKSKFDYDTLVFDTYDFLDKVLTFSLEPAFCAACDAYYSDKHDERARLFSLCFKYGTSDNKSIMLMRYGFNREDLVWLLECVDHVDEHCILFNDNIRKLPERCMEIISPFVMHLGFAL